MLLQTALAGTFSVGGNVEGDVPGANWLFLLPQLSHERVLCLGVPAPPALDALARAGRSVIVAWTDAAERARVVAAREGGLANVHAVAIGDAGSLPFVDAVADLILVARRGWWAGDRRAEVQRLLAPGGAIYVDTPGRASPGAEALWLMPLAGEAYAAAPAIDEAARDYLLRQAFASLEKTPLVRYLVARAPRLEPALARILIAARRLVDRPLGRRGLLIRPDTPDRPGAPPAYLRSVARGSGVDIDSFRWGLFARGEYRSRKVLFFLFRGSDTAPALVVKMTRHPSLNARLENEGRALALLQSRGIGERGTLPEVAFFGHHGGLAILGQTAIDGIPLRHRTALTADCACARAGAALLTDLGAATAERNAATPEEVTVALGALCEQFERIYDPAPRYRAALRDQLAAIAASPAPLPLVFQHGDPGIWNALVTPAGRIAFLDWEAAEPQGLPLWDLFYYLHSYCIAAARARGIRGRLNGFSSQFLRESDLSPLIVEAIEGYCARLGVPRRLVEPLLLTCWMHRALKEANRLPATKLASGHFFGVLKRCIDERDSPILARLAARHSGSVPLREPAPAAQGSAADA